MEVTSAMRAKQSVRAAETHHLHCPLQAVQFSDLKMIQRETEVETASFRTPFTASDKWFLNGSWANDQHNPSVSKGPFTQRSTEELYPLSRLVYSQFKQTTAGQPGADKPACLETETLTLCLWPDHFISPPRVQCDQ